MRKKLIVLGAIVFFMLSAFIVVGVFQQKTNDEIARRPYRYGVPAVRQYYRGPAYYTPRVYRRPYYRNYYHRPYYHYHRGIDARPGHVSVGPVHVDY